MSDLGLYLVLIFRPFGPKTQALQAKKSLPNVRLQQREHREGKEKRAVCPRSWIFKKQMPP